MALTRKAAHAASGVRAHAFGIHIFLALLLFAAIPAAAGDDPPAGVLALALQTYQAGAFEQASELARGVETAEGLTLAARAALAYAAYAAGPDERAAALDEGERLARKALRLDPDHVEALLDLAIALGYRSRLEGPVEAHFAGYGREAHKLIERAIAIEPRSAWAHAANGGWHAEVVRRGGAFLAGVTYGASKKKAFVAYEQAVADAPSISVIRLEYAKALIRIGSKAEVKDARRHLEAALARAPADAMEGIAQNHVRQLLAALDSGDKTRLMATLAAITPFEH